MNANIFNFFLKIYLSFFSAPFYRNVYFKEIGFHFNFLLLVISLISIPSLLSSVYLSQSLYDNNVLSDSDSSATDSQSYIIDIINNLPTIHIKNGAAEADVKQPYIITSSKDMSNLVIIDTTNVINDENNLDAYVIINRENAYIKTGATYSEFNYKDNIQAPDYEFSGETLRQLLIDNRSKITMGVPIITYMLTIFSNVFESATRILLYAVVAFFLGASLIKSPPNYGGLIRIGVFSSVPFLFLKCFERILLEFISFNLYAILLTICSLSYYIYALSAVRGPEKSEIK